MNLIVLSVWLTTVAKISAKSLDLTKVFHLSIQYLWNVVVGVWTLEVAWIESLKLVHHSFLIGKALFEKAPHPK